MQPSAPPLPRSTISSLTLAVGFTFVGGLALGPILPLVAAEYGVGVALLGQVPSSMNLLAAGLGLVIGPLAERSSYRLLLLIGVSTMVVSAVATGLAPTFLILMVAGLIGAVGRAAVLPMAQALVGRHVAAEADRRGAIARLGASQMVALVLGIPVLTTIAAVWSWRAAFMVLAVLGIASLGMLWGRLPGAERSATMRPLGAWMRDCYAQLLRDRTSLGLIGATLLVNSAAWVVWLYLGAFFIERHHFIPLYAGWVYLALGLASILSQALISGRLGAHPWVLVTAARAGCGLLWGAALLVPLPAAVAIGLLVLAQLFFGLSLSGGVILLVGDSPAGRATTLTLNASAMSVGAGMGGALGGLALTAGGYNAVGTSALLLAAAATALAWWVCPARAPMPFRFAQGT